MLSSSDAEAAVRGTRVLVSASRSLEDENRMWGTLREIEPDGRIGRSLLTGSTWPSPLTIHDLRRMANERLDRRPLESAAFDLVRIDGGRLLPSGVWQLECRTLTRVAGAPGPAIESIRLLPSEDPRCTFVGVGDVAGLTGHLEFVRGRFRLRRPALGFIDAR